MSACHLCMSLASGEAQEEWPSGHFACGPIGDADIARWRAGERPLYEGGRWTWGNEESPREPEPWDPTAPAKEVLGVIRRRRRS